MTLSVTNNRLSRRKQNKCKKKRIVCVYVFVFIVTELQVSVVLSICVFLKPMLMIRGMPDKIGIKNTQHEIKLCQEVQKIVFVTFFYMQQKIKSKWVTLNI